MLKLAPRDRIRYQFVNDKEESMIILITSYYFFSISLEVCSRAGYMFEGSEKELIPSSYVITAKFPNLNLYEFRCT